jgi:hypothetical protein
MIHRFAVVVVVVCLIGMILACGGIDASPPKPIPRKEFEVKVIGKTEQEVIQAVGEPEFRLTGKDSLEWVYQRRTIDPTTKGIDASATIGFDQKKGKVSSVDFQR